jgi:pyruvate dehydrogenase E1 component alpha subunit
MKIIIPKKLIKKKDKIKFQSKDLLNFENRVIETYEKGKIKAPVHLSRGNEKELIEIFKYISNTDWVFSSWRNHYHALLHGIDPEALYNDICSGRSMTINSTNPNFYSSSIVGGIIPISLGVAKALKLKKSAKKVWCFIGDMTFESGTFYEVHKYARNFNLPLQFVVEDNNMSTNTPTDKTWLKKRSIPDDVIYYKYKRRLPHHGTGKWVLF